MRLPTNEGAAGIASPPGKTYGGSFGLGPDITMQTQTKAAAKESRK